MPKLPPDASQRRRVLIIAPDFTPSSYPPALRARFFAQHLRDRYDVMADGDVYVVALLAARESAALDAERVAS